MFSEKGISVLSRNFAKNIYDQKYFRVHSIFWNHWNLLFRSPIPIHFGDKCKVDSPGVQAERPKKTWNRRSAKVDVPSTFEGPIFLAHSDHRLWTGLKFLNVYQGNCLKTNFYLGQCSKYVWFPNSMTLQKDHILVFIRIFSM